MMKVLLLLSILFSLSFSATITFNGLGGNNFFNTPGNWAGGVVPVNGDIAVIPLGSTVQVNQATTVTELVFNGGIGGPTTFTVFSDPPSTPTFQCTNITFAADVTINVQPGCTFTAASYGIFSAATTITFNNFGNVNFNPRFIAAPTLVNNGQNNVVLSTSLPTVVSASVTIPQGFAFSQTAITFFGELGNGQITFNYRETIAQQGWVINNVLNTVVSMVFRQGVNINGAVTVSTGSNLARPTFTFDGTVTVANAVTLDVNPTIQGASTVTFSGATLTFNDKSVTFSAPVIAGNGGLVFTSSSGNQFPATISGSTVTLTNPSISFTGRWTFGGNDLVWNTTQSLSNNYTVNNNFVFNLPLTINNGFQLFGSGGFNIYDSLTANIGYTWNTIAPRFSCSLPARTFSLTGQAQNFDTGFSVAGCTMNVTPSIVVRGGITTINGNSTLPGPNVMSFPQAAAFSGSGGVGALSINLPGAWTTSSTFNWQANNVELIIGGTFSVSSGSNLAGSGIITLLGNVSFANSNQVNVILGFNNNIYTITGSGIINFNSPIILRNAYLTGSAEVWFNGGTIYATKGVNTIDNASFRFKSGFTANYLFDNFNPNIGAQLFIRGNGQRYVEGTVNSVDNFNIVFVDQITYNRTISINGAGVGGGVTFLGVNHRLELAATVTYTGNVFLNNTVNMFIGQGTFTLANNINLYLLGNVNPSSQGSSSTVTAAGTLNIIASANAVIGQTVVFNGALNTFDSDTISTTANQNITFEGNRNINGIWTFGANVLVLGSLTINTATSYAPPGFLSVGGNSVVLGATATFSNNFVLTQATTITTSPLGTSRTLTLTEAASPFAQHGVNLPAVTITNPATLIIGSGSTTQLPVAVLNGAVSGNGIFITNTATISAPAATSISVTTQTYSVTSFVGTGPFTLTPTTITFSGVNNAFTTVTVTTTSNIIGGSPQPTLSGFVFSNNPTTFVGNTFTFTDVRTINTNWIANTNLVFNNDVVLGAAGLFNGNGQLNFITSLTLGSNIAITTNNVVFGNSNTAIVIVAGAFTLTLNNRQTTVNGKVVSGGANIVSTSPSGYVHILAGNQGVIPPEWTWSNTIQIGNVNVTATRTLTSPLMLTDGVETVFNGGVVLNGNGAITYDNIANTNNRLRVEGSFTTNTPSVIPNNIQVSISGPAFTFAGTNVLSLNGTFNCQTRITFSTSVTFGYLQGTTPNQFNINPSCYLLGTTNLIVNRATVQLSGSNQNLFVENPITFGLLPPLSTTINTAGGTTSTLLFRGNWVISGNNFAVSSANIFQHSISITTLMNSTLSGINPNASLTFISSTAPWVEPQVAFTNNVNQVINLNGPIRLVSPTITPNGGFIGAGNNRVAFVNGVTFQQNGANPVVYTINAPIQFYVLVSSTTFQWNIGNNNVLLNSLPSTFNQFGYSAPNVAVNGAVGGFIRTLYTGSLTVGDLTLSTSASLRLSSGSLTAATLTVNTGSTLWVDTATLTTNNLIFSSNAAGDQTSVFQYTISSATPTAVNSQYTFYQGNAVITVVNFNWDGTPVTAINSVTANNNVGGAGVFNNVFASPGYAPAQQRNGNSMQFRATVIPSISPSPTQSNGPSPAVSSSTTVIFNFALLALVLLITLF